MSDKELIWVQKDLAQKFNNLSSSEEQEKLVTNIINDKKLDITNEMEYLEENLLMFKGVCLKHKNELTKVYNEETSKLEDMYDHVGEMRQGIDKSAKQLTDALIPLQKTVSDLKNDMKSISDELKHINVYGIERFLELVDKINAMDEGSKEMLKFLMKEYK